VRLSPCNSTLNFVLSQLRGRRLHGHRAGTSPPPSHRNGHLRPTPTAGERAGKGTRGWRGVTRSPKCVVHSHRMALTPTYRPRATCQWGTAARRPWRLSFRMAAKAGQACRARPAPPLPRLSGRPEPASQGSFAGSLQALEASPLSIYRLRPRRTPRRTTAPPAHGRKQTRRRRPSGDAAQCRWRCLRTAAGPTRARCTARDREKRAAPGPRVRDR
jgi:hypothetical protein